MGRSERKDILRQSNGLTAVQEMPEKMLGLAASSGTGTVPNNVKYDTVERLLCTAMQKTFVLLLLRRGLI